VRIFQYCTNSAKLVLIAPKVAFLTINVGSAPPESSTAKDNPEVKPSKQGTFLANKRHGRENDLSIFTGLQNTAQ
jgi:hypothetical protein